MDEASFKKFYPEEWEKQQIEKQVGTIPEYIDPNNCLLSRFAERAMDQKLVKERLEAQNDFDKLSNLKKEIVRRKIKKLIRRNQREIKRNEQTKQKNPGIEENSQTSSEIASIPAN